MRYTTDDTSSQSAQYQWTTGNLILDPGVFAYDLPRLYHRGMCGVDDVAEAETAFVEAGRKVGRAYETAITEAAGEQISATEQTLVAAVDEVRAAVNAAIAEAASEARGVGTAPDTRGNDMLLVGAALLGGFLLAAVLGR
jgi:hypothetical protein